MGDGMTGALERLRPVIEKRLDELVPEQDGPARVLRDAMRWALLAPGKRLRPALCMKCAAAVGGKAMDALDAGCAIEMIHCFSLIHDDLPAIDNDDLRRGRQTLHRKFTEATAILAGDALFARAFEVVGASANAAVGLASVRILTEAVGVDGLVGGEYTDVASEGSTPSAELVEFIHTRKTGALFAAACSVGALYGGASAAKAADLRDYGAKLGLAFQIADDILNETAAAETLGKAVGSDQDRGKQTYPAVFGLDRSRRLAQDAVDAAIKSLHRAIGVEPELEALARFAAERNK